MTVYIAPVRSNGARLAVCSQVCATNAVTTAAEWQPARAAEIWEWCVHCFGCGVRLQTVDSCPLCDGTGCGGEGKLFDRTGAALRWAPRHITTRFPALDDLRWAWASESYNRHRSTDYNSA